MHVKSDRQKEIEARLEELDAQRRAAKEEGAKLVKELHELLTNEQAAEWGVTPEQYTEAKKNAFPDREARRDLEAWHAKNQILSTRVNDVRKSKEVREEALTQLKEHNAKRSELEDALTKLESKRIPLALALKQIKGVRKSGNDVQSTTATPAAVGANAKK